MGLKPDRTNSCDLLSRKPDLCPVEMVLTTDMQQNRKTAGRKPERVKDDDGTAQHMYEKKKDMERLVLTHQGYYFQIKKLGLKSTRPNYTFLFIL